MAQTDNSKLTLSGVKEKVDAGIYHIPHGFLGGGIAGVLGKGSLSFFNPALASQAGNFLTFAGMGFIAVPLTVFSTLLLNRAFEQSTLLNERPRLKNTVQNTATLLSYLGAVTSAALLLGTPLGASLISMMVVPTAIWALSILVDALSPLFKKGNTDAAQPYSSLTAPQAPPL